MYLFITAGVCELPAVCFLNTITNKALSYLCFFTDDQSCWLKAHTGDVYSPT